jgi:hypothetical protein
VVSHRWYPTILLTIIPNLFTIYCGLLIVHRIVQGLECYAWLGVTSIEAILSPNLCAIIHGFTHCLRFEIIKSCCGFDATFFMVYCYFLSCMACLFICLQLKGLHWLLWFELICWIASCISVECSCVSCFSIIWGHVFFILSHNLWILGYLLNPCC